MQSDLRLCRGEYRELWLHHRALQLQGRLARFVVFRVRYLQENYIFYTIIARRVSSFIQEIIYKNDYTEKIRKRSYSSRYL